MKPDYFSDLIQCRRCAAWYRASDEIEERKHEHKVPREERCGKLKPLEKIRLDRMVRDG